MSNTLARQSKPAGLTGNIYRHSYPSLGKLLNSCETAFSAYRHAAERGVSRRIVLSRLEIMRRAGIVGDSPQLCLGYSFTMQYSDGSGQGRNQIGGSWWLSNVKVYRSCGVYFVQCIADSSVHISRITNVHSVSILNSANNHNSFSPLPLGLQFSAMSSAGVRKSFRARAVSDIWLVPAIADPE